MSLINKVLRDLETHREASEDIRAQQSPLVDAGLHPVRPVRPRLSRTQLVRIGLLLGLLVVAALAWFQWGDALLRGGKPQRGDVPVAVPRDARPSPVAPVPAPLPQKTAIVPPPQETKPQHTDAPPAVPKDAKPAEAAKSGPPKKAPSAAAPSQDVVVRKPSFESTKAEMEAVKATTPVVTAKAEPPVARKPEAAPDEIAEKPDQVAEEPEEASAPKAPAAKPRHADVPAAVPKDAKTVLEKKLKPLTPEERAEGEYRLAAVALQKKRTGEAESRLRTALAAQPSHVKARELLAGLALQGGRWREAQSLLEQGAALNPNHYPFAQLLARSYVDHGQEKRALELLEKSRTAAGGDPEYLAFLATLYQRAGRQNDAAQNFSEALKQRPQEGRWWLGLAISLEAVEKWKESAEAYQRASASGSLDKQLLRYSQQRLAVVKNK